MPGGQNEDKFHQEREITCLLFSPFVATQQGIGVMTPCILAVGGSHMRVESMKRGRGCISGDSD